jgi:hypothetical protein
MQTMRKLCNHRLRHSVCRIGQKQAPPPFAQAPPELLGTRATSSSPSSIYIYIPRTGSNQDDTWTAFKPINSSWMVMYICRKDTS